MRLRGFGSGGAFFWWRRGPWEATPIADTRIVHVSGSAGALFKDLNGEVSKTPRRAARNQVAFAPAEVNEPSTYGEDERRNTGSAESPPPIPGGRPQVPEVLDGYGENCGSRHVPAFFSRFLARSASEVFEVEGDPHTGPVSLEHVEHVGHVFPNGVPVDPYRARAAPLLSDDH